MLRPAVLCLAVAACHPAPHAPGPHACAVETRPRDREDGSALDAQGDHLPRHAIARLGSARLRHADPIEHLAFCGGALISSDREVVNAWDPVSGARQASWRLAEIVELACVDGVPHATTRANRDATLDVAHGTLSLACVAPKPAPPTVVIASDRQTATFGSRTFGPFHGEVGMVIAIHSAAASANTIAIGTEFGMLYRFDATSGEPIDDGLEVAYPTMSSSLTALAFSPNGDRLAIGGEDQRVRVIDARATTITLARPVGHEGEIRSVVFSPDGARIATASADKTARVWDARTGGELARLAARDTDDDERDAMMDLSWVGDAITTTDIGNAPRTWRGSPFVRAPNPKFPAALERLTTTGDRASVLVASPATWWLLDASSFAVRATGALSSGAHLVVERLAVDQTGARVAICTLGEPDRIEVHAGGATLFTRELHADPSACPDLALSPDGRTLAIGGELLDLATNRSQQLDPAIVATPVFSPDGARMAGAMPDGEVRVWNVATHAVFARLRGHDGAVLAIAWSPTGDRLVSVGRDLDGLVWMLE